MAVLASDQFTGANTGDITGRTTDSGAGGVGKVWANSGGSRLAGISSNQCINGTGTTTNSYDIDAGSGDVLVTMKLVSITTLSASFSICARQSAVLSTVTFYRALCSVGGTLQLQAVIAGSASNLGATQTWAANDVIGVRCNGTTIELWKNGAAIVSVTDATIPNTNTKVGFRPSATVTFTVDNFIVVDAVNAWAFAPTDLVGVVDALLASQGYDLSVTDPVGVVDSFGPVAGFSISATDPVGVSDAAAWVAAYDRTFLDSVGVTDLLTWDDGTTLTDPIGVTDSTTWQLDAAREFTDPVGVVDDLTVDQGYAFDVTEPVGVTDDQAWQADYDRTFTDDVGVSDGALLAADLHVSVTDLVGVTDALGAALGIELAVTDLVGVVDAIAFVQGRHFTVTDLIGVVDQFLNGGAFHFDVTDLVGIRDRFRTGHEPSIKAAASGEPRGPATSARPAGTTVTNVRPTRRASTDEPSTP